ncbi:hypothetical protein OAF61_00620 [Pseudomonadales bacterium]|nr:hypothetical protein [Pseudomonadales bacterium]
MKTSKPAVYIASAYTSGDVAMNTHFQCKIFNQLLDDDLVLPIAPLWSHFQHTVFPRQYEDWINYDQALLPLYDACLRLDVELPEFDYQQLESKGADAEVEAFNKMNKPVFHSIDELYAWVKGL